MEKTKSNQHNFLNLLLIKKYQGTKEEDLEDEYFDEVTNLPATSQGNDEEIDPLDLYMQSLDQNKEASGNQQLNQQQTTNKKIKPVKFGNLYYHLIKHIRNNRMRD